jgi:ParB family chromosome partitioning protein
LSALLGEPVRTQPPQAQPAPQTAAPEPRPNVVELPTAHQPPVVNPAPAAPQTNIAPPAAPPQAAAPAASAGEGNTTAAARNLPIELVHRNPAQPRKHFDEAELTELSDSIRAHGVLQPILVRPAPNGRFEIVAGERRWRAAQRAGLHVIPAVIRELDEVEVLEIGIIENVQRSDLNPIEEAQGYQALIDRFGRTQQDLADVVGKSRPHIANMLRLLTLPDDMLEMVRDGRLSAGHARAILTAPDPKALALRVIKEGLSVREIEKLAAQAKDEKAGIRPPAPPKDADTVALERSLAEALGLGVIINDKSGAGEVRISYRNLEQLDDVVRRLRGGS